MGERVAIVGSRPERDTAANEARKVAVYALVKALPHGTIVVSGGAEGVDYWAQNAAAVYGLIAIVVHPAWRRPDGTGDRGAGIKRNAVIVELADRVVAFWDGSSRGTASTIELARKAGKPVEVIT
jgi:predicted Rossmann fold nucleotide-binding protein DprA/Smf involved in DNA uptake